MPRLHQVSRAETENPTVLRMYDLLFGSRDPVTEPGTATGTRGDWWPAFANSTDVFEHAVAGFGLYRSPNRRIDPVLRELGQTRAGWAAQSQFVFSQHCKSLRGLGVPDDKIDAIRFWQAADCFTPVERLVLAYTDCLVYDYGRVPDELFAALREHLDDVEMLELTYITCLYLQHAVMSRALRTEWDDVEDRITEVATADGENASLRISLDDADR
jgi:alkylhydroperoxidase family enzyme